MPNKCIIDSKDETNIHFFHEEDVDPRGSHAAAWRSPFLFSVVLC